MVDIITSDSNFSNNCKRTKEEQTKHLIRKTKMRWLTVVCSMLFFRVRTTLSELIYAFTTTRYIQFVSVYYWIS